MKKLIEKIKPAIIANNSLFPKLWWMNNSKIRVQHKGSSLQDRMTFIPRNIVNSLFSIR